MQRQGAAPGAEPRSQAQDLNEERRELCNAAAHRQRGHEDCAERLQVEAPWDTGAAMMSRLRKVASLTKQETMHDDLNHQRRVNVG